MISFGFTGVDGSSTVSLSKKGEISKRDFKNRVFVIPSDRLLYLTEKVEIKDRKDVESYVKLKVEEKFGSYQYDFYLEGRNLHIAVIKNFDIPESYYALDGEMFSLLRFFKYTVGQDGYIFDLDEGKFTFLEVASGKIRSYRVITVNSDQFILNLDNYIDQLPLKEGGILVCGNSKEVNKLYNICRDRFGVDRVALPSVCKPSEVAAFGAALKGVLGENFLSFKDGTVSPELRRSLVNTFAVVLLLYLAIYVGVKFYTDSLIKEIKRSQVQLFKKVFPDQPVVSVYEQTKAMVKTSPEFNLSRKLLDVELPKDVKIYKVEYIDGVLTIKGESKEPPSVAKSVKKTPLGNFEFEVKVR
ncbi:MAG: hypothetical protein N2Z80_07495 [Hydrogenothermaceae bacterium]|nr:hypothetical protein [Hydrogenothermaceae bacterium]